ncbi:hypothetical protein HC256_010407 [Beauveria bassiana]|nr:hypothetical protein HC256_010407 [Beauveria bassiana]
MALTLGLRTLRCRIHDNLHGERATPLQGREAWWNLVWAKNMVAVWLPPMSAASVWMPRPQPDRSLCDSRSARRLALSSSGGTPRTRYTGARRFAGTAASVAEDDDDAILVNCGFSVREYGTSASRKKTPLAAETYLLVKDRRATRQSANRLALRTNFLL